MPLCALRSMQIFTRRPNAASRTVRVAASKSASRSSGQFRIAAAVSRAISFPARTSSTMRSRSISSNFNITGSFLRERCVRRTFRGFPEQDQAHFRTRSRLIAGARRRAIDFPFRLRLLERRIRLDQIDRDDADRLDALCRAASPRLLGVTGESRPAAASAGSRKSGRDDRTNRRCANKACCPCRSACRRSASCLRRVWARAPLSLGRGNHSPRGCRRAPRARARSRIRHRARPPSADESVPIPSNPRPAPTRRARHAPRVRAR